MTADAGQTKVYGDADPVLTYQVTSGSLASGDAFTGALARTAGEHVADSPFPITQGTLSLGDNYTLAFIGASFAITPRPVTVTADAKTKVYGDADPALTYQVTSGTLASGDDVHRRPHPRAGRGRRQLRHHAGHAGAPERLHAGVRRGQSLYHGPAGHRHGRRQDQGLRRCPIPR